MFQLNTKKLFRSVINIPFKQLKSLKHLDIYLFFFSCVIIIVFKFIQFPSLTYNAEIFAESATNFFIFAYKYNFLTNITATDAGYLPLTQRFIALILVKLFHLVDFFPYASQFIAIVFIAVMSSLINLRVFKTLNSSDFIRFVIGIAIGLISDYELNTFINFVYYGAILLFFGIITDKEKLSRFFLVLLTAASMLIILSKGQFIIFLPIFLIMAYLHIRKKQYKSLAFYAGVITAGVSQLGVMSLYAGEVTSGSKIQLLPYFVVKTIYYYVLTYRHVFFGYVTKEGTNVISIGILVSLFLIAIKIIWRKKDKQALRIFFIGNFIAFCSLFLTVFVPNSSLNPQVQNITSAITKSSSIISASQRIVTAATLDAKQEKNIFDIKHFANLRARFISNLLIFLTGIVVLLKIFSKKLHKIIFLLLLCFTSGAFGQISVEEVYADKSQSYSQWQIYSKLLKNERYCIPVNHYPFLLKQKCDYLFYKDPNSLESYERPVSSIVLSKINPLAKNWQIQGVILVNKPNQFNEITNYTLYAYDAKGNELDRAKQLVPSNYEFIYYLFDKPLISTEKLIWKNVDGHEIKIVPNIFLLGTSKG